MVKIVDPHLWVVPVGAVVTFAVMLSSVPTYEFLSTRWPDWQHWGLGLAAGCFVPLFIWFWLWGLTHRIIPVGSSVRQSDFEGQPRDKVDPRDVIGGFSAICLTALGLFVGLVATFT
ncbi:hypothetical protein HYX70_01310 [Candidatus Saccharibacteria bacterium]|nr:hypothetical protein [Candidatus Saccharibacteria bacterium]